MARRTLMETVAAILLGVTALAHFGFMAIEMFPWRRPFVFDLVRLGFNPQLENERIAAPIVHNAGLYNGFIAAGLIWGLLAGTSGLHQRTFFLGCGIVAGIFGAISLTPKTLVLQTLPAAAAMVAVYAAI
jgi:putative membrane protein